MSLELWSVFATSIVFCYAAYQDVQTRTVSNVVWGVAVLTAAPLILHYGTSYPILYALTTSSVAITAYTGWFFNMYGGADVKAIVTVCIAFPQLVTLPGLTIPHSYGIILLSVPLAGTVAIGQHYYGNLNEGIPYLLPLTLSLLTLNYILL